MVNSTVDNSTLNSRFISITRISDSKTSSRRSTDFSPPSENLIAFTNTNYNIFVYYINTASTHCRHHRLEWLITLHFITLHSLHTVKLSKMGCTRDCWKCFFLHRVVNRRNMLDQQIVGATSLNAVKNGLDKLRKTKMGLFIDCSA